MENILIYKKLNLIMGELPHIPKDRKLEFNGRLQYKFRGVDDIYAALNPLLVKHNVVSVPYAKLIHQEQIETSKTDSKTGEVRVSVTNRVVLSVTYDFIAEDGSKVSSQIISEGMDTGDKACNKAMSAAHKYALLQVFCIPTEEPKDSEIDHHEIEKKNTQTLSKPLSTKPNDLCPPKISSSTTVKADSQSQAKTSKQSEALSIPSLGDYVITFGKYKDRTIQDIAETEGPSKVSNYIQWLENDAKVKNKPMTQAAKDFIEAFDCYVGTKEMDQSIPKETLEEKMDRLKNQHPGVPGPPMPKAYKDDETTWDPDESWPESYK